MASTRLNKRQRQAKAKRRELERQERLARVAQAERIPRVRSNVSSWDRAPTFNGVGYQSGFDPAASGMKPNRREIGRNSGMKGIARRVKP